MSHLNFTRSHLVVTSKTKGIHQTSKRYSKGKQPILEVLKTKQKTTFWKPQHHLSDHPSNSVVSSDDK